MKEIYNSIKEHIRLHPKVTSSAIGKIQQWKRSHFVLLSEIVQDVLSESEELQGEKKNRTWHDHFPYHLAKIL